MLSLPRNRSLCGKDHRNLASRSTLPPCCNASHTHATCSGEKASEEEALTSRSPWTASGCEVALRSIDNSAVSRASSLMHSPLSDFTFSFLMSFAVVTSLRVEDIFQAFPVSHSSLVSPSLPLADQVTFSPCERDRMSDSGCKRIARPSRFQRDFYSAGPKRGGTGVWLLESHAIGRSALREGGASVNPEPNIWFPAVNHTSRRV